MKYQLKILILGILFFLSLSVVFSSKNWAYHAKVNVSKPFVMGNANNKESFVYLSDIPYMNEKTSVKDGYYLHLDKNNSSGLISVLINNEKKSFIKGISAWATSTIVYDLQDYDYDYFTAYLGVDSKETSNYYNSGVKFTIATSSDGINWQDAFVTNTLKGVDNAVFAKVNIQNIRYLKLYAYENGNSWYSHWYDDAVYANAKLIKEDYEENDLVVPFIKTLDEYDEIIKGSDYESLANKNLLLFQREFVKRVGYDVLQSLANYKEEYLNILKWLMEDEELLNQYLLGGEPDGNYVSSLKVLNELYQNYAQDLQGENKELYEKMMISLSLTHSANVGLWVSGVSDDINDPNGSKATSRYEIFKKLYLEDSLDKDIFTNLSVEEMRFVMNNIIDDEEIIWLNHYSKEKNSTNPYSYITYRFGYNYPDPKYYDYTNYRLWSDKYHLEDYNITYKKGYPKLWIVFEEGSVCGGLSKTGSNIWGSYGVPSSVVSQPGHAAYIYMSYNQQHQKIWNLANDVSGWGQSGKTEKLSVRMPNGWGSGSYAGAYPASYILLAQSALNDYDSYVKAENILLKADVYKDDFQQLETIYEDSIKIQAINFDAWLGLVNLYVKMQKSDEQYLRLAQRIVDNFTYYPLPMDDLLRIIEPNLKSHGAIGKLIELENNALNKAVLATEADVLQPHATKQVANYLLKNNDTDLATFSFDGENAGKIILSDRFTGNDVQWQYNLVSGIDEDSWKSVSGKEHLLTAEELSLIHSETDILVRIVGALDNVYAIDILQADTPHVFQNDLENRFYGIDNTMEWQMEGQDWISFAEEEPNLTGNKTISLRVQSSQNKIASEALSFQFTENDVAENSYIPNSRLSVYAVSSEELERENNASNNAIDGNINKMWHTNWDGSDWDKYIVLKLDKPTYLSALEYVPRQNGSNGIVKMATIQVSMDGENWENVLENVEWSEDASSKKEIFAESVKASYVKLIGVETVGNYMSASLINLFEDKTKTSPLTVELEYNHTYLTNQDVTVKLVNANRPITVINNEGLDYYTFKENGSFTFNFVDEYQNEGSITAKVDWIDKELPNVSVTYEKVNDYSEIINATLVSEEEIKILNNDGSPFYNFTENGSFEFSYQDLAGNIGTMLAKVDSIQTEDNLESLEKQSKEDSFILENSIFSSSNINTKENEELSKKSSGDDEVSLENKEDAIESFEGQEFNLDSANDSSDISYNNADEKNITDSINIDSNNLDVDDDFVSNSKEQTDDLNNSISEDNNSELSQNTQNENDNKSYSLKKLMITIVSLGVMSGGGLIFIKKRQFI